jgi:phosphohistidine swiveling domain-containing protein
MDTGLQLGNPDAPLILSVRSGAAISMPGIMQTILNVGINKTILPTLNKTRGHQFALRNYLRLVRQFGAIVFKIGTEKNAKIRKCIFVESEHELKNTINAYEQMIKESRNVDFPQEPLEQLRLAISAVFESWLSPRATTYRQAYGISDELGTAVIVQMMVFGDYDKNSGSGVVFTRNTKNGNVELTGEFSLQAQGEEIVSGQLKGSPISKLKEMLPETYAELKYSAQVVEKHYKRVQDIEFTIQSKKLWLLQTRNAPLDPEAAVKIVVQMVRQGLIEKQEAVSQVPAVQLEELLNPGLAEETEERALANGQLIAQGISTSSGVAIGKAVITSDEALQRAKTGEDVILIRSHLDPDDIEGMSNSKGIVSSHGGVTSHAALIAKNLGKVCVMGCEMVFVDETTQSIVASGQDIQIGETLTISGKTGRVFRGQLALDHPRDFPELSLFQHWARQRIKHGAWSRAVYSHQAGSERDYLAISRHLANKLPWTTDKANVIEALKLLHPGMRIRQVVAAAHDIETIREQMYDVVNSGYWNGPRTCYYPYALGKAGWHMAITTIEEVDEFLNNPNFKGFSGAGGYPRWIQDPNLREIITVYDPPKLGLPEFEHEHFVFTISCGTNPDHVLVEMNIGTAQLRSIEKADSWELIYATMQLDHNRYHNKGRRRLSFGGKYLRNDLIQEIANSINKARTADGARDACVNLFKQLEEPAANRLGSAIIRRLKNTSYENVRDKQVATAITSLMRDGEDGEISLKDYPSLVESIPLRMAHQVIETVFDKWWEKPFELPFVMQALEEVFRLQVLEIQGRFSSDGKVDYMLVYDAKGREESIAVKS